MYVDRFGKRRDTERAPGHCRVMPQNDEEATTLRTTLECGQPLAIACGREFPETFSLMGRYVSVNPVHLNYSQVILKAGIPMAKIKAGKSIRLAVTPTPECVFSIEQSDSPCLFVSGLAKSVGPAGEVDMTAS